MNTTNGFARKAALFATLATLLGTCPGTLAQGAWDDGVNWSRAPASPSALPAQPAPRDRTPGTLNPKPETPAPLDDLSGTWLSERLSVGLALSRLRLTDNHRTPNRDSGKTFIGFLNYLDLENEIDWSPVVSYWIARYLRVSATWEHVEAGAYNYDKGNPAGRTHSDGTLEVSGPVLALEATWPLLDDTLFPHVGLGAYYAMAEFHEATFWWLGYSSQEVYEANGSPHRTAARYTREIHVDDSFGWLASAGVAWRPVKHFQLDFDVRQTCLDVDCEWGYMRQKSGWDPQSTGSFTLDNLAFTLSASYVF